MAQPIVREVPDYARQYLIEHPELGPPISPCGAGAPARESTRNADTPVRQADINAAAQRETPVSTIAQPKMPQARNAGTDRN
jgi:hypothetical protein